MASFWSPSLLTFRIGMAGLSSCACLAAPYLFIIRAFADMGFAGEGPARATSITIRTVRKPPDQVGFAVHPRRWVDERFFAWISRNRQLWRDPEATLASARAFLRLCHAPHPPLGTRYISLGTDSKARRSVRLCIGTSSEAPLRDRSAKPNARRSPRLD